MAWFSLILGLALAAEPPTDEAETASDEVDAAATLAETDPALAKQVLTHLSDSADPVRRERADNALEDLPRSVEWGPTAGLFAWQTLAGAWAGGPAIALATRRPLHPNLTTSGMAIGAVLGGGSALVYGKHRELDGAGAGTIIGAQQLGAWHGTVAAVLINDTRFETWTGASVGLGLGAVGGYLANELANPQPNGVMGGFHGALWGTGIGYLGMAMLQRTFDDHWRTQWVTMLLATDLGAVGGYALGQGLGLDRVDFAAADLGIGLGLMVAGIIFVSDRERDVWGPSSAPALMLLTSVAGGTSGVLLSRKLRNIERMPDLRASRVKWQVPTVAVTPRAGDTSVRVSGGVRF